MKLLLSVTLLGILSISAEGLQCQSCTGSCSTETTETCSTETMCITAAIVENGINSTEYNLFKGCASSSLCSSKGPATFSVDLGHYSRLISAECCDTDGCNAQNLTNPTLPQCKNGLICSFCYAGQCGISVDCEGVENRCFQGTDMMGNPVRGCASSNVCQPARIDRKLPFFEELGELQGRTTCCDTTDCNDGTPQGFQCLSCTDSTCSKVESVTCSTETMCITASSISENIETDDSPEFSVFKGCASFSLCPSTGPRNFSLDLGLSGRFTSAECCDTDNCNSRFLPKSTPPESPNSLQCLFCGFGRCDIIVNCLGEDDRCIEGNDMMGNPIRGCASANVCPPTRIDRGLPFFEDLAELTCGTTCCDTNWCNDGTTQGLQCLSCADSTCSKVASVTCPTGSMCITATSLFEDSLPSSPTELSVFKGCASPSLCPSTGPTTFSVDLGVSDRFTSAECCDTHNCNFNTLPRPTPPPPQSTNSLRCFKCVSGVCFLINSCQGEEDRCFRGTDVMGNPIGGCASANACQVALNDGELPFGQLASGTICCETSLCNRLPIF